MNIIQKNNEKWGIIYIRTGCTNNCIFCSSGCKSSNFLISDYIKKQETELYEDLINLKKQKIKNIEISGEDPIEYDKILYMIRHIKESGFKFVHLLTHGKRLSDKSFFKELILSGVNSITIPLYGSNAKIHDLVTQTEGSFDATIGGIKELLKHKEKIKLAINCLIIKQNKNDLIELVKFVKKLKIKYFSITIPDITIKDTSVFYIPLKEIGPYVKSVYEYASKIDYRIVFTQIPYCVFGKFDKSIINKLNIEKPTPLYRIKKQINMCKDCIYPNFCDGFFIKDIDRFGIGGLKPII